MKRLIAVVLTALLLLNITACSGTNSRYEAQYLMLFDTVTQLTAYTKSEEKFNELSEFVEASLREYHQLYDIYNDYDGINNIKTINDSAGIVPVKVDKRIIELLKFSREQYDRTSGKVNVAFGAVLKIWHNYRTEGIKNPDKAQLPPIEQLREASKHTDINNMIINEAESTVFLTDREMSLDVGAVAKGYATQRVCREAEERGYTSALMSVGGNVMALGKKGDGQKWNVGIQNPDKGLGEQIIEIVYVDGFSVVTSGRYERFYTVAGQKYHHIIDPVTLYPSDHFASVTVIASHSGVADGLTTALFNMTVEEGVKLIESMPDTEAMWVLDNNEIKYSSGFENYSAK